MAKFEYEKCEFVGLTLANERTGAGFMWFVKCDGVSVGSIDHYEGSSIYTWSDSRSKEKRVKLPATHTLEEMQAQIEASVKV